MAKNDGGPAFPVLADDNLQYSRLDHGMSLREWFAGQALVAIADSYQKAGDSEASARAAAHAAYLYADAMLFEGKK